MSTFRPKPSDKTSIKKGGKSISVLRKPTYDSFDTSLLGLGDITKDAVGIDTIAAVFDLQGFTNFCKQIEPHLAVPLFLSDFLSWLLQRIKHEMTAEVFDEGARLYCPLPYFVKFMGDGLLVLWDASETTEIGRRNIIVSAWEICRAYKSKFLPSIAKKVVDPPTALRCGLARGMAFSVGDGNDYVGSCINMAARLEKTPGATFAFNRRGFNLEAENAIDFFKKGIVIKRTVIRGIGENELVGLLSSEFNAMTPEELAPFKDP